MHRRIPPPPRTLRVVISLRELGELADRYRTELAITPPVLTLGGHVHDLTRGPLLMGTVNLSRDSTYRESIATDAASAVRKARVMSAQGAALVDIGAESTTARASRVHAEDQAAQLTPIVASLTSGDNPITACISVETYDAALARACLGAGAGVLNITGAQDFDEICSVAAEHAAAVVVCAVPAATPRDAIDVDLDGDPIPPLLDLLGARVERAHALGVVDIVIDPGMGFYYGSLVDPLVRARHQARVITQSFRLRVLGRPICNALPHAFDLFEDEFRTAEGFFAVLATLGGTDILRTHEVPRVAAVVAAMQALGLDCPG